jgi:hypothetical protein
MSNTAAIRNDGFLAAGSAALAMGGRRPGERGGGNE